MPGIIADKSVTETRADFVKELDDQRWENRKRARQLAREMVVAMADRDDFTVDDFMFAATLGMPENYPAEKETITTAASLKGGEIIGLVRRNMLDVSGITASKPFSMRVKAGNPLDPSREQYNRELEACLTLAAGTSSRRGELLSYAGLGTGNFLSPVKLPILRAWGESERDHDAFYEPTSLVVGSEALVRHVVETGDELGQLQVAECLSVMANLAYRAYGAAQE